MVFGPKFKIDRELYERLAKAGEKAGYSSTDEFILHILQREVDKLENALEGANSDEEVERQLRGLGYIE